MALRKFVDKLTKPVEELDRQELATWSAAHGDVPFDEVELRRPVRLAGEVSSVRIVPRVGGDALEATVHDGHASVTAVFLGRRKIHGLSPGRRVVLEGVVAKEHDGRLMYNPIYTLQ